MHEPRPTSPAGPAAATRGVALATALAALGALAELGETIEDEWSYVTALAEAGRARLRAAAGGQLAAELAPNHAEAVDAACVEACRITDPHRAIDWLSTLPAVVELALGADRGGGPALAAQVEERSGATPPPDATPPPGASDA